MAPCKLITRSNSARTHPHWRSLGVLLTARPGISIFAPALNFCSRSANGAGSVSAFGSYTWDACLELANAIPVALKGGQPGSVEFRRALRDALEATRNLEVSNGAVNMSKTDHLGLDARARVMVQIQNGKRMLQK